jgi:hypothetical protein
MADDETKQILRDILATQKEQLESFKYSAEMYDKQAKAYDQSNERYWNHVVETSKASNVANILRAVALVLMAAVLAYLVLFGLHKH